jgi:replication termination factor 2
MGNDGGSIARRADLVKTKQRAHQMENPEIALQTQWSQCALSQQPLQEPIVACELGRLYNKAAVIENHLMKETRLPAFSHIRALKDLIPCNISWVAPSAGSDSKLDSAALAAGSTIANDVRFFQCPITAVVAKGRRSFVVMRECGCVLSRRAIKEVPSKTCLVCSKPISEDALQHKDFAIPLYSTSKDDIQLLRENMEARRHRLKQQKKQKKKKKQKKSKSKSKSSKSTVGHDDDDGDDDAGDGGDDSKVQGPSISSLSRKRKAVTAAAVAPTVAAAAAAAHIHAPIAQQALSKVASLDEQVQQQIKKSKVMSSIFLTEEQRKAEGSTSFISSKPWSMHARM